MKNMSMYFINMCFIVIFSILSAYSEGAFRVVVIMILGLILAEIKEIIPLMAAIIKAFCEIDKKEE